MDAAIAFTSARNPSPTRISSSASPSSRVPQRLRVCGPWRGRGRRLRALRPESQVQTPGATAPDASHHDVVIVGAGIVGLAIARHLLLHSPLSVAVADAAVPCSGATGAGQGYIWMSHRKPGSDTWELAMRSKQLWEELAAEVDGQGGGGARERLGWMRTGSLLVGRTSEELTTLQERANALSQAGIHAEFLSASSLHSLEPALSVGKDGGALFLPQDCQIDAFQAVSLIEKTNNSYSSKGRYMELYNDPAMSLIRSEVTGTVEAVQTSRNILYGRKAIVIASGAWTRSLLHSFLEPALTLDIPVKPRKGHLLVVEKFDKVKLNHALMEVGYVDHQVAKSSSTHMASESSEDEHGALSISMTATLDTKGNLVLGSSREFKGFSREVDKSVVKCIWERAGEFFPAMKNVPLDIDHNTQIRIGHRPYMPDGKPVIGFIPDLPNVLIATGHEGNGLTLALGTAEMVSDMILGNPGKVDCSPFAIKHRFSVRSEATLCGHRRCSRSACLACYPTDRTVAHCVNIMPEREPHLPSPAVEIVPSKNVHPYKYAGENIELHGMNIFKGKISVVDIVELSKSDIVASKGERPLKCWESSIDLVNVLKDEIRDGLLTFRSKRVLELGCGYGLPGIFACLKGATTVHFQDPSAETVRCKTIPNVLANLEQAQDKQNHRQGSPLTPSQQQLPRDIHLYAGEWEELHTVLSILQEDDVDASSGIGLGFCEEDLLDGCNSQDGNNICHTTSSRRSRKLSSSRAWERGNGTSTGDGGYDIVCQ